MTNGKAEVWIFMAEGALHPSAVFSSRDQAETWITRDNLTGVLTAYPLDQPVFNWAIEQGFVVPKKTHQREPGFIGSFTSASMEHYHYVDGRKAEEADES